MRRNALLAFAWIASLALTCRAGEDWDTLEGRWTVESVEVDGNSSEPGALKFDTCRILKPKPGVEKGTDAVGWLVLYDRGRLFQEWPVSDLEAGDPKWIRLQSHAPNILAERVDGLYYHRGIYRLKNDTLTICLGPGAVSGRPKLPKSFEAGAGTGQTLIRLKRRGIPANQP